jgi:hypothetical protein
LGELDDSLGGASYLSGAGTGFAGRFPHFRAYLRSPFAFWRLRFAILFGHYWPRVYRVKAANGYVSSLLTIIVSAGKFFAAHTHGTCPFHVHLLVDQGKPKLPLRDCLLSSSTPFTESSF